MEILMDDREVDALLILHSPVGPTDPEEAARCVAEAVERGRTKGAVLPWIFASWIGVQTAIPARRLLESHRIPTFQTPSAAIRAFQYLVRHRAGLDALMQTPASFPSEFEIDPATVRRVLDDALRERREVLLEPETRTVLRAYRMPLDEAVEDGIRLYAAAEIDGAFGPVIRLGLGGRTGVLVPRVAVGLPPLNQTLALDLIRQFAAEARLGDEISAVFDAQALGRTLVQLSHLIGDFAEIRFVRLDPLFVGPEGVRLAGFVIGIGPALGSAASRLAIPPYPKELEAAIQLPDGSEAVLRPIRPEDEPALHAYAQRLSPEHVRLRFFQPLRELGHEFAARLTQIDYDRHMAFILTRLGAPGGVEILGVVRLIRDPAGTSGEYAITVRSDLNGKGIGRLLMERIIAYARAIGLEEVFGLVMAENRAMLELARKLGFQASPEPDEPSLVRVSLPLKAA
jgi:acetyltransferase